MFSVADYTKAHIDEVVSQISRFRHKFHETKVFRRILHHVDEVLSQISRFRHKFHVDDGDGFLWNLKT